MKPVQTCDGEESFINIETEKVEIICSGTGIIF